MWAVQACVVTNSGQTSPYQLQRWDCRITDYKFINKISKHKTHQFKEEQHHTNQNKINKSKSNSKQVITQSSAFLSHSLTIKRTQHTHTHTTYFPSHSHILFICSHVTPKAYKLHMKTIRSLLIRPKSRLEAWTSLKNYILPIVLQ